MSEFKKILDLCKSENMYEDLKNTNTEDYLFEYFNKVYQELEEKSTAYKSASDAKCKIMRDNDKLWNIVENDIPTELYIADVQMLMSYISNLKDENNEVALALYLQGVKDGVKGDFSLDFTPGPRMTDRVLELVVELAKETGKSIDEVAKYFYEK